MIAATMTPHLIPVIKVPLAPTKATPVMLVGKHYLYRLAVEDPCTLEDACAAVSTSLRNQPVFFIPSGWNILSLQ